KNEAAVAKWLSADNQLLHRRMSEGLDQIIEMLNLDFLHPQWRDPAIPADTISFWDALSQKHVKLNGHILYKEQSRIIFQTESQDGRISDVFSVIPE
ncbi:MAG: hypothetical protein ACREDS_11755, partial [Limisphaerales bacterium]